MKTFDELSTFFWKLIFFILFHRRIYISVTRRHFVSTLYLHESSRIGDIFLVSERWGEKNLLLINLLINNINNNNNN